MINKSVFYSLLIVCAIIMFVSLSGFSQNRTALTQEEEIPQTDQTKRPNLLRELDLTPDQVQQIRQLNQASKAQRQAANRRLKAANDALDEAIYGDVQQSDAEVQARIREVHAARLEVLKNRVASEQSVRRLLSPQQVGRFRELKRQYNPNNQMRQNNPIKNPNNMGNGLNRNPNRILTPRQQLRMQRVQRRQQRLNP